MALFHIYKEENEVNKALADFFVAQVNKTLKNQDRFTLNLTGGSTPKGFYHLLATEYKDKIDWQKIHVFWGDERYVRFDDERNNARMTFNTLLNAVSVPPGQIRKIRTDIPPNEAAKQYSEILHNYFDGQNHSFDFSLLGLGSDGHTLSLFPGHDEVFEEKDWVLHLYNENDELIRITLTPPLINSSACTVFLAMGNSKAPAVFEVLKGKYNPEKYPAQLIQPSNHIIHWFMDEAAAFRLTEPST